jgi:hypothetical protein
MILQLNPAIPMTVIGKGDGLALAIIDYGMEFDLLWVIAIDETGEIWTVGNPKVRALKNITQGRLINKEIKMGEKWIQKAVASGKGKLHKNLGVKEGEKIPAKKLAKAAHSKSPTIRKEIALAKTLKGFKKK